MSTQVGQYSNVGAYSDEYKRTNFLWGFIGHNTTGKTPTAIEIVRAWKQSRPGWRSIVFDPQGKFKDAGCVNISIQQNTKDWARILCSRDESINTGREEDKFIYKNSLLILDDYRMLHASNSIDPAFLDLLALRVRMNLDIIYITHNPKLILERLSYYTTDYSIFYTEAQLGSFASRIPKYVACQKAAILVNKYALEYGRGKYPNFPHIHVKNESDELDLINIDQAKMMALLPKPTKSKAKA